MYNKFLEYKIYNKANKRFVTNYNYRIPRFYFSPYPTAGSVAIFRTE